MQKIGDLSKWFDLRDGASVDFTTDRPRPVKIRVNAPGEVSLYITPLRGSEPVPSETRFLATFKGLDTLEFFARGAFRLTAEGSCQYDTQDGTSSLVPKTDERIFTKMVERRQRNPQMEYMQAVAELNLKKRLDAVAEEHARRMEEALKQREAADNVEDQGAGAGTTAPKKSVKAGGGKPPAPPAGGDEAGDGTDGSDAGGS